MRLQLRRDLDACRLNPAVAVAMAAELHIPVMEYLDKLAGTAFLPGQSEWATVVKAELQWGLATGFGGYNDLVFTRVILPSLFRSS